MPDRRARPYLLDLTRLMSRVGRGPRTGIDRVEAAYLAHLLSRDGVLFGLVRTSLGFILLDRNGVAALRARLEGRLPWGRAGMLARVTAGSDRARQRAESDLRRLAAGRATRGGLARLLRQHLPEEFVWLNVGHSNLGEPVFQAVHQAGGMAHVLVHDMIPLDHPGFQRPGTVEKFERRMQAVCAHADRVIYNSGVSRDDAERYFNGWGRVPAAVVAHLGVDDVRPDRTGLPEWLKPDQPYFTITGTIEPRKNHALLLDVWQALAAQKADPMPQLLVIGARGWNNRAVFDRLDARPPGVIELPGLSDGAMAALVAGARAALFPSLAEGFGLPPCEAHALGTPVVANDLPVLREVLGNIPIYASVTDMYSWLKTITVLADGKETRQSEQAGALPTWLEHFNLVLKVS